MKRFAVLLGIAAFSGTILTVLDAAPAASAPPDSPTRALHAPTTAPDQLIAQRLGGSSMAHIALLATPDGRDLIAHAVSCALPSGASFTAIDRDGTPFSFSGALGLAPAWAARATTVAERDRLTVCLRSYGFGTLQT